MKLNDSMHLPNAYGSQLREPKTRCVFALESRPDGASRFTQCVGNFEDECFLLTSGMGQQAAAASRLLLDTALWAYKLVRQKRLYWGDKPGLLGRIFRSSNLLLWHKRTEPGFEEGLTAHLLAVLIGPRNIWIRSSGQGEVFLWRNHRLVNVTPPTKEVTVLGQSRRQNIPIVRTERFFEGERLVIVSPSLNRALQQELEKEIIHSFTDQDEDPPLVVSRILDTVRALSRSPPLSLCIVWRLAHEGIARSSFALS